MPTHTIEIELTRFVEHYDEARNLHDAGAMALFFALEGDLVVANWRTLVGRDAIRENFAFEHSSVYRSSTAVRTILRIADYGAGFAGVSGRFIVSGTRDRLSDAPIEQQPGLFTWLARRGGAHEWEILAYRSMAPTDVFLAGQPAS